MSGNRARQARSRNSKEDKESKQPEKEVIESKQEAEIPPEPEIPTCFACVEPITYFAIGNACDHKELCARCAIRQRKLYGRPECVFCLANHSHLIITKDNTKSFDEYDVENLPHFNDVDISFQTRKIFNKFDDMFKHTCAKCNNRFGSLGNLKTHLKEKHNLVYCNVCLDHVRNYLEEFELFTPDQLQRHIKTKQHSYCRFCKKAFYDDDELWMHKYNSHEHCRVCCKRNEEYLFFSNYKSLANHYRREHYVCNDPLCLASKHVAFESELDLREHVIIVHPKTEKMSRSEKKAAHALQIDFQFEDPISQRQRRNGQRKNQQPQEEFEVWPEAEMTPIIVTPPVQTAPRVTEESKEETPEEILTLPPLPTSNAELKNRNRMLIKTIKESLLKEENFDIFKKLNIDYVNGSSLTAKQFHTSSIKLFRKDAIHPILMELMSLLPDVKKRVELKAVHETWYLSQQKKNGGQQSQKKKQKTQNAQQNTRNQNNKKQNKKQTSQNKNQSSQPSQKKEQVSKKEQPAKKQEQTVAKKNEPLEKRKEDIRISNEANDSLFVAPEQPNPKPPPGLHSSSEFPSLSESKGPPGLVSVSAGLYADKVQGGYKEEDFPQLQRAPTPEHSTQQRSNKPSQNSNSKRKKKQQRKKNILFTVG